MDAKPSEKLSKEDRIKVFRRALSAYYADPDEVDWPDTEAVGFRRHGGLNYVTLYDQTGTGLLACYRVRHDGKLKRLTRPPEGLE